MIDIIKKDLPNFPDEVIAIWLEPYFNEKGWPPKSDEWNGVLFDKPIDFWKCVKWDKKELDLFTITFCGKTLYTLEELKNANLKNEKNFMYGKTNGTERYMNVLLYLLKYGKFPKPICVLKEEYYSIVDGYHRMVALLAYQNIIHVNTQATQKEHKLAVESFKKTLKERWDIIEICDFSPIQEVWHATPN